MSRFLKFIAFFAVVLLVGCSKSDVPESAILSITDLANKKVGVIKGSTAEDYALAFESDSGKMILERFANLHEMLEALSFGKLDAVLSDDIPAKMQVRKNSSLRILDVSLKEESYAGIVAKGNWGLLDSVNIALIQMRATGVYDSIVQSYCEGGSRYRIQSGPVKGAPLKLATYAKFPPFVFYNDKHEIVGSDIDIVRYVANYLERPLEIIDMDFDKVINAVRDGKADLGFATLSVTEERQRVVDFTDNYATSKIIVVVRGGKTESYLRLLKETVIGR